MQAILTIRMSAKVSEWRKRPEKNTIGIKNIELGNSQTTSSGPFNQTQVEEENRMYSRDNAREIGTLEKKNWSQNHRFVTLSKQILRLI